MGSQTGFVGFSIDNKFGWIKLKVGDLDNDTRPDQVVAIDWAYESMPGLAIAAGQKVSAPSPLMLLAAGAVGITALRKWQRSSLPLPR